MIEHRGVVGTVVIVLSIVGLTATGKAASLLQPIRWRHVSLSPSHSILLPAAWLYGGLQEDVAEPAVKESGDASTPEKKGPRRRRPRGAVDIPDTVHAELNIPYAGTNNPRQKLDLYLPGSPASTAPLPVVAFIHGGAFLAGNKRNGWSAISSLVESGDFAGVSIGYRLTGEAIWPAQIHDCKAAIRWIRANAKKYNLDPDRIGVMGSSAGGHLAAMLGTSGDVAELEGTLGENGRVSSRVTCVVDRFGPADLLALYGGKNVPNAPEAKLVGGPLQDNKEAARRASPTTYATADDAKFLIIHGTEDTTVRFDQSERMLAALKKAGVNALLVPVVGGRHGDFGAPEVSARIRQFFDKYLRAQEVEVSGEPIAAPPQNDSTNSQDGK